MTSRQNETLSIKVFATYVAISAISLTTTVNTTGMFYSPRVAIMSDYEQDDIGTNTLTPKTYEVNVKTNYEQATELFSGEMRDFTKEEAKQYQESLEKIYRPIGVNVFDLC